MASSNVASSNVASSNVASTNASQNASGEPNPHNRVQLPPYSRGAFSSFDRTINYGIVNSTAHNPSPETQSDSPNSTLIRGLQIPTRRSQVSSGFKLPPALEEAGVSAEMWRFFTKEVKNHASLSARQWTKMIFVSTAVAAVFWPPPAVAIGYVMCRDGERENFLMAAASGSLKQCAKRWNKSYFNAKGLVVDIDIPGDAYSMQNMDLSTSKLFRYQKKNGSSSPVAGSASPSGDKKEFRYQAKEGHARVKAARKGRISIKPL